MNADVTTREAYIIIKRVLNEPARNIEIVYDSINNPDVLEPGDCEENGRLKIDSNSGVTVGAEGVTVTNNNQTFGIPFEAIFSFNATRGNEKIVLEFAPGEKGSHHVLNPSEVPQSILDELPTRRRDSGLGRLLGI